MKSSLYVALLALLVASTGCYKYAIKVGEGGSTSGKPTKSEWAHHFIWGVMGESAVDTASACNGSPNATVVIERNVIDSVIFNVFGQGIWAPSTVDIFCGPNNTAQLEIDRDRALALVKSPEFLDVVAELAPERLADATELRERVQAE